MKKTVLIAGVLAASVSTVASAGFFGHLAEHALGYAAGGVMAHEADRAIDGYYSRNDQSQGHSSAISLDKVFDSRSCDQVLRNNGVFTTCYSYQYKSPSRCLSTLDGDKVNAVNIKGREDFYPDRNIPQKYRSYPNSYRYTGMDRGHTCASDASFDYSPQSLHATYAMSNISMQEPESNRKSWIKVEKLGRLVARKLGTLDTLTLVFFGESPRYLGQDHIAVPVAYGRVLLNESKGYRKCFYMPNDNKVYTLKEMQMDCGLMISKYEAQKNK